jgi:hydroxyacylglutathione hydrolase
LANLDFAMAVDGNNKALQKVQQECLDKRALDQVTLPTSLGQEANINPFVRTHDEAVIKSAQNYMNHALNQPSEVFAALRSWKNRF